MFDPVPARVSFPQLEEETLRFWHEREIFRRSIEERPADRIFSFYEGPPTANGNPGIHHVLARVFKDLIPRYRTMQGDRVPRKGGWDTHGLPVELEVERQLNLHSKREIEAYGVEAFNRQCRESVFRYVREWERMTQRIAFWVDTDEAYVTYSNEYVESCWWIFRQLFDHQLVFRDYRVTPHCPRCGTSLSSHEIALGYKEQTPDPAVTVAFRLLAAPLAAPQEMREVLAAGAPTSLLAWTTTPWTLSGNTALAVNPDADYSVMELLDGDEATGTRRRVILATALVPQVIPGTPIMRVPDAQSFFDTAAAPDFPVEVARLRGRDLLGCEYEPLYEATAWVDPLLFRDGRTAPPPPGEPLPPRRVIGADIVSIEEGTGVLHVAPAFGADDYELGRREGLLFLQPVRTDGTLIGGPGDGLFAKEADRPIMDDLWARGALFKREQIRHTYPFCWRCDTPVLYYAKPSWYIRTTAVRDELVASNRDIHWVPDHIRDGRFGEWLEGNIDWAVSRERYWGTPLPFWVCEQCGTVECIGSYEELRVRSGAAEPIADPHRPYIDAVMFPCAAAGCDGVMRRTPEVADAWFDSGAMPYAQWHYPFEQADVFAQRFPADFICEAVDQTRGWFYTLHALANLLHHTGDAPVGIAYRHVICLGHILDGDGLKMSKSRGNVVDPWSVLDAHGADAVRWYMYTAAPPGNSRRFSSDLVGETARRFLSTLWNTYSFFVTYANIAGFDPASAPPADRSELDRWIRSELHETVRRVTAALDAYEPADAARPISDFVEQLSNWYVRRSRRRFWKSDDSADTQAALHTLYECLVTTATLLAPFTPFVAERLYRNLVAERVAEAPESVHLAAWPQADPSAIDPALASEIAIVQRMVSLGRAARAAAGVKVRQPLAVALLAPRTAEERAALAKHAAQIADELNVKQVDTTDDPGARLTYTLRPNLPVLGPKYGSEVGRIRQALQQADGAEVARQMRGGHPIAMDGFTLGGGEILVTVEAAPGWAASEDAGYVALLDATLTPDLEAEGLARDLVRQVQELRRQAGLDVTDRIRLRYQGDPAVGAAIVAHGGYVAEETLAVAIEEGAPEPGATAVTADLDGVTVTLSVARAATT